MIITYNRIPSKEELDYYTDLILIINKDIDDNYVVKGHYPNRAPDLILKQADFEIWERKFYYFNISGIGFIEAPDFVDSRDVGVYMMSRNNCPGGLAFSAIRTPDKGIIIITKKFVHTELKNMIYQASPNELEQFLIEKFSPGYMVSNTYKKFSAKTKLLRELVTNNIMGEMEKQIDILSKLVFILVEKLPPEEIPDWFEQYKNVIQTNDSLKYKTIEKSIESIEESKSKIRESQELYFRRLS